MSGRLRSYYPDSSIEKGLYTPGGEYMTIQKEEYIGFYHKYTTGEIFTLHEYSSFSEKLIPYENQEKLSNSSDDLQNYRSPIPEVVTPKLEDFNTKESWKRYFVKKVGDIEWGIREISKEQYDETYSGNKNPLDRFLFETIQISWKLTGQLRDTKRNSINYSGVYDTNLRTIQEYEKKFVGITKLLKDPLQYTIYSKWYEKFIKIK